MTLSKNALDPIQHPQKIATMAISIAATTFTPHPLDLDVTFCYFIVN